MTPFWITGLPRSRTAWFSIAMRGPRSSCVHELTAETQSFADLKSTWLSGALEYSGNSDSACGLQIERILDEIKPRTLIIERPMHEVIASTIKFLQYEPIGLADALIGLNEALKMDHPLIKRVRFRDLRDADAVREAAEWLVPGQGAHAASLHSLNIQAERGYALTLIRRPHTLWHMERVF